MRRKTQGVISIFLIIMLLPMMTLGAVLIDGARLRSAKMMVQEAADIAAISVLADYNTLLKDEFGLFALNNSSSELDFNSYLKLKFDSYLKTSLNAYDTSDVGSYSGIVQNVLQKSVFGGGEYAGKNFLNLYNFRVTNSEVEAIYSLEDIDILECQIVEYAKYRGIIPIVNRLPILHYSEELKEQIENSEKALDAITEKIDIDDVYGTPVDRGVANIDKTVKAYNDSIEKFFEKKSEYYDALSEYLDTLKNNPEDGTLQEEKYMDLYEELEDTLAGISQKYLTIKDECTETIKNINIAIEKYKEFSEKHNSFGKGTTQKGLSDDAKNTMKNYEDCKNSVESLLLAVNGKDISYIADKAKLSIIAVDKNIEDAIDEYNSKNDESDSDGETEENNIEFEFIKTNGTKTNDNVQAYNDYYDLVSLKAEELKGVKYNFKNPLIDSNVHDSIFKEEDSKNISKEANSNNKKISSDKNKVTITSEEYELLPSKNKDTKNYKYTDIDFEEGEASKSIKSISGSLGEFTKDFIGSSMNDMLVYSYILGTFKTRMTHNENIKYDNPPKSIENYHTKWRYGDKPVSDLRGNPIADRITRFHSSEIEYIFAGDKNEAINEATVYGWISTVRMANNLIAVYLDKDVGTDNKLGANTQCMYAAEAAAAAAVMVGFPVPVSVFHWMFMTAWAAGETALEMKMLVDSGYSIPLVKDSGKLYITDIVDIIKSFKNNNIDELAKKTSDGAILLAYEDYLVIMLAFVGKETRLYRTADLIQLNMMKNGEQNFKMNNAYTDLKTFSDVGIKYLFFDISQFRSVYESEGIRFENTIYKGY